MKAFTALYSELDATTSTSQKVQALEKYFRNTPPRDAVWALAYLIGKRPKRGVTTTQLKAWMAEHSGYPEWLIDESYDHVGDLAETLALLKNVEKQRSNLTLCEVISEMILPLSTLEESEKKEKLFHFWNSFSQAECFIFHKLLTGGFRVGVSKNLVIRGLSRATDVSEPILAHRLSGVWQPDVDFYDRLTSVKNGETAEPGQPYPFFLAHPLPEKSPQSVLPEALKLQVEWKWDGVRAQLIKRDEQVLVWSRGEEALTDTFPEIIAMAEQLPDGTVLDGEVVVWKDGGPGSFFDLQKRLGRKKVSKKMLGEIPVLFMAYDLLEVDSRDIRPTPLRERRIKLEELLDDICSSSPESICLSEVLQVATWDDIKAYHERARASGKEGLMIKNLDSGYQVGRKQGAWWKWKVDPHHFDAVLLYAQKGHGRRADLFTDYTFAVWNESDELVPVAKAYSGLTDKEIREVDAFVRSNTKERFGPVRSVTPELVFELAFEGIRRSSRHKSGVALRFPRMKRLRRDKSLSEIDTLTTLSSMIKN